MRHFFGPVDCRLDQSIYARVTEPTTSNFCFCVRPQWNFGAPFFIFVWLSSRLVGSFFKYKSIGQFGGRVWKIRRRRRRRYTTIHDEICDQKWQASFYLKFSSLVFCLFPSFVVHFDWFVMPHSRMWNSIVRRKSKNNDLPMCKFLFISARPDKRTTRILPALPVLPTLPSLPSLPSTEFFGGFTKELVCPSRCASVCVCVCRTGAWAGTGTGEVEKKTEGEREANMYCQV